ncbi:unnamed protein product [Ectocarpus fasciculatus]
MAWKVNDLFSGRPSSRPPAAKASSAGKRSSSGSSSNSSSSSSASGPPATARSGQAAQGGVINSALWAIARTQALVDAVEHVETKYGDPQVLSGVLHTLRQADLNDTSSIRQATDAASMFLQAHPCAHYTQMHPMEAIRGIVGTCVDSDEVFQAALATTYRITESCTLCPWKEAKSTATENKFECTTSNSVQMAIELRSAHNVKTGFCGKCDKKSIAKRYRIERGAPCFVATWTGLSRAKPAQQESLFILTTLGESLRFSIAVMIAFCDRKAVCLFSEGSNYYKVEGSSVKVITRNEWQNIKPCLALFSRQGASLRIGGGPSSFANGGSAKAGRKRQREENGNGQYSVSISSGGSSRARGAAAAVAAAAEVIELDDDDTDGGDASVPAGGSGRGKDASSSRQNGSGSGVSHGGHEPSSPVVASENGATASGLKGGGEGKREGDSTGRERKVGRTAASAVEAEGSGNEGGQSGSSSAGVPDTEPLTFTGTIKRMLTGRPDGSGWLRQANTNGSSTVREGKSPGGGTGGPGPAGSGATEPREPPEVHDVDDDVDPPKEDDAPASKGKRHPSGVPMPFIGPARPPPAAAAAAGRALPRRPKPLNLPQEEQRRFSSYSQSPWLTSKAKPRSESNQDIRRNFSDGSFPNGGGRRLGGSSGQSGSDATSRGGSSGSWSGLGGGAAKGSGGQNTILSSWEKKRSSSSHNGTSSGGGRGNSSGDEAEWRPPGKGAAAAAAAAAAGGGGGRAGLRSSSRGGKVLEDLTGADEVWEDMGALKSVGVGGGGSAASVAGGGLGEGTLTTIRGINLQQDHFDRIVDSDGWLTSQIIDIRVKQLQERFPQHLYFDSSFFGFLCPTTEKGGAFVVDYERVAGWTKQSRLPGGKSSLFDMRKLFIPINQGNVHWVLVVVDMDSDDEGGGGSSGGGGNEGGGGGGGGAKVVSFFDSFGRDGTPYVEAVQQYLVSELSSRDKTRQDLFTPRPRPPHNAPRQHNSSDCGVLMLHVMEELSTGPTDALERLTQEQIKSQRLHLVAKIVDG